MVRDGSGLARDEVVVLFSPAHFLVVLTEWLHHSALSWRHVLLGGWRFEVRRAETRRPSGSAGFKGRRRSGGRAAAATSAEREPLLWEDAAGCGGQVEATSPGSSSSRMGKRGSGRGGHEAANNRIHLWQRGGSDGRDSSSFIKKTTAAPPRSNTIPFRRGYL